MANAQAELDNLSNEVTKTEGVEASAAALITGFAAYIAAHKNDPVAIQAFADRLNASATSLGDAVASNPLPDDGTASTGGDTGGTTP